MSVVNVSETKLQPLGDRVVIRRQAVEEVRESGIVIPGAVQETPNRGQVLAVGPKVEYVRAGQTVVFNAFSGYLFREGGEELVVLRETELQGILREKSV